MAYALPASYDFWGALVTGRVGYEQAVHLTTHMLKLRLYPKRFLIVDCRRIRIVWHGNLRIGNLANYAPSWLIAANN